MACHRACFSNALFAIPRNRSPEAKHLGAAYEGSPTKEKALVYGFEGGEYLVPVRHEGLGPLGILSTVHLERAKRVLLRPRYTSKISEMRCSSALSSREREALLRGIQASFPVRAGHSVRIVTA